VFDPRLRGRTAGQYGQACNDEKAGQLDHRSNKYDNPRLATVPSRRETARFS
jgi:hypothetical protein